MRSLWFLLKIHCDPARLLALGIAPASTSSGAETRAGAFEPAEGVNIGVERSLSLQMQRGCEPRYDRVASDFLLAARPAPITVLVPRAFEHLAPNRELLGAIGGRFPWKSGRSPSSRRRSEEVKG
jgi:hypothetical protein